MPSSYRAPISNFSKIIIDIPGEFNFVMIVSILIKLCFNKNTRISHQMIRKHTCLIRLENYMY